MSAKASAAHDPSEKEHSAPGAEESQGARVISRESPRVCLFGAAPDTGNLGVSALFESIVAGVLQRLPEVQLTVFDNTWGIRQDRISVAGEERAYERCGGRDSKRYHRSDSLANIAFCCRFGGLHNQGSKRILRADALLDVSGGDSFTDLYGMKRFNATVAPKRIAVRAGVPLILVPQTYGPYADADVKRISQHVIRGARAAWARDEHSYEILQEMLGDQFDPKKHRSGVDVAFRLPVRPPAAEVPTTIRTWLDEKRTVVGFNVSGLVYSDPAAARDQFSFRADYRQCVEVLLERVLREDPAAHLLLVPHVKGDVVACEAMLEKLNAVDSSRVAILPLRYDQGEIKWIIKQLSWFCGTRMHSTIASLSSGVPTAAIAYSDKTHGVFETCDQQDHVLDPRKLDTDDVISGVYAAWQGRAEAKERLAARLPEVLARADEQMDAIARLCLDGAGS